MAGMEKLGAAGGPGRHPTPTCKQVNSQGRLPGGGVTSQRWSQPEEGVKAETAPWGRRQLDLWTFEWEGRGWVAAAVFQECIPVCWSSHL